MKFLCRIITVVVLVSVASCSADETPPSTYCIEGKVTTTLKNDMLAETLISVDGGKFHGFPNSDGTFSVCDVPPGSYLVEVVSPNDVFEPVRVDVSGKSGKIRARKAFILKTKTVSPLPYPISFKMEAKTQFFKKREPWNILSILKNPMVLFMVAPLLLMMVLPRLMKSMDPEQQKEMQESMSSFQGGSSMPSMEDMFTNFFGGGGQAAKKKPVKKTKH